MTSRRGDRSVDEKMEIGEVHKCRVRVGVNHLRRSQYLSPTNRHVRLATLELQTNGLFWLAELSTEVCDSCVGTVDTCTINAH
jgi:hypothetical protein